jgi:hypothetical protein
MALSFSFSSSHSSTRHALGRAHSLPGYSPGKIFSVLFSPSPSSARQGQASTEYLVVLAITLALALVVLGVAGFFPSFSYDAQAGDSVQYWARAASPLAIVDSKQTSDNLSIILENHASATLHLTAIHISLPFTSYSPSITLPTLPPGGRSLVWLTTSSCTGRQTLSYNIQFNYSTDQVSNLTQESAKPLYVQCSD